MFSRSTEEKVAIISDTRPALISNLSSKADRWSLLISGPVEVKILIFSFMVFDFCGTGLKAEAEGVEDMEALLVFLSLNGGLGARLGKIEYSPYNDIFK